MDQFFRGMATANYWADDVSAARDWYAALFGVEAYFQRPDAEHPAYVEFRIGDDTDEFGIVDRRFAPKPAAERGGIILYWHVDDPTAALQRLVSHGATELEPVTPRGDSGFVTASVIDPFGNILGIMYNPHWEGVNAQRRAAG